MYASSPKDLVLARHSRRCGILIKLLEHACDLITADVTAMITVLLMQRNVTTDVEVNLQMTKQMILTHHQVKHDSRSTYYNNYLIYFEIRLT